MFEAVFRQTEAVYYYICHMVFCHNMATDVSNITVSGVVLEGNSAINRGGLFIESDCAVSLNESEISNNSARDQEGIFAITRSTVIIYETSIYSNKSKWGL